MAFACYRYVTGVLYLFELYGRTKKAFYPTIDFYIDILARMNYIIYEKN
jgi:hypothetical protein